MKKKITAGVIQLDIKSGEIDFNLSAVFNGLNTLASRHVDLAVLPEMFSCSFDNKNLSAHSQRTDEIVEALCRFANQNQMAIAGTLPFAKKDQIFNVMVFIDRNGEIGGQYKKIHLFRLTQEDKYYSAGDKAVIVNSSIGRIGLMTCYDLRFPELARTLYLKGAQMIVVSAQWPMERISQWQTLIRARAVENQLFMICANRIGREDGLKFSGHSIIVDPVGNILAEAGEKEIQAVAEIDLETIKQVRMQMPCMSDRRPEVYG